MPRAVGRQAGQARHPRVGLRHNPLCLDAVRKGIAGDNEFGRDDPRCAELCCSSDCLFDKSAVSREIAGDRCEMEQCDA